MSTTGDEVAAEQAAELAKAEQFAKWQAETMVALFHGDTQVTDWVPFLAGKVPVPDEWVKSHKYALNLMPALRLRMQNGNGISAARTHVQEHVVKSYLITWRTVW
jgi:hypothetical protein